MDHVLDSSGLALRVSKRGRHITAAKLSKAAPIIEQTTSHRRCGCHQFIPTLLLLSSGITTFEIPYFLFELVFH